MAARNRFMEALSNGLVSKYDIAYDLNVTPKTVTNRLGEIHRSISAPQNRNILVVVDDSIDGRFYAVMRKRDVGQTITTPYGQVARRTDRKTLSREGYPVVHFRA